MPKINRPAQRDEERDDPETVCIGIDPGASGGIAILYSGFAKPELHPMPDTEYDIWELISRIAVSSSQKGSVVRAAIEKVGGYVKASTDGMIGGKQPGASAFKFGLSYGGLRMAVIAAGVPIHEVIPRKWQWSSGISVRAKGETRYRFKARIKARAQQLYPGAGVTLKTCDALLIARYCQERIRC